MIHTHIQKQVLVKNSRLNKIRRHCFLPFTFSFLSFTKSCAGIQMDNGIARSTPIHICRGITIFANEKTSSQRSTTTPTTMRSRIHFMELLPSSVTFAICSFYSATKCEMCGESECDRNSNKKNMISYNLDIPTVE